MPILPASRRDFMKLAGASAIAAGFPRIATANTRSFPTGFKWGAGSAAAQVESRQGRGRSNWDVFIDQGGHVRDGSTNVMGTDFENRFMEDFQLLSDAGVQSFRFSFAWPRIQPEGPGTPSAAGLDTYDRMIDGMLHHGIEPFATMFHWDVPVWAGDFRDRDITARLAEYADIITRRFGDRIKMWAALNEPNTVAFAGYAVGMHAPGLTSAKATGAAIHHQNLSLGLMAQAASANLSNDATLTTTVNLSPMRAAAGNKAEGLAIVSYADDFWNRSFLDPLYGKGYPVSIMPMVDSYIQGDDMDIIAINPTTLGVNYYCRVYVRANPEVVTGFVPDFDGAPQNVTRTDDYFVEPDGLNEVLQRVHASYGQPRIFLTETGFALKDASPRNGLVNDPLREKYLKTYLKAAHDAIAQGIDLRGIYYWSATDNFEWTEGFAKKFGLIQVDTDTLKRTPKSSLRYYGKCANANALV
ncbi:MAG: family 1 glycosylhydrolase [Castellaniella sp.]